MTFGRGSLNSSKTSTKTTINAKNAKNDFWKGFIQKRRPKTTIVTLKVHDIDYVHEITCFSWHNVLREEKYI